MKRIVVGIALAAVVAGPGTAFAQDGYKTGDYIIEFACKSGLTDEDRDVAAAFLAERSGQLRSAPSDLVTALQASGIWVPELYGEYASEVPSRLARQMSAPKAGTRRIIFDRTLLVISSKGGRVMDSVRAR